MAFEPQRPAARRILVIEDDPGSRLLLARALEARPDVDLVEAASAVDGVTAITLRPPDLVILDSRLPDMPGSALLQWLRDDPTVGATPVIVVSADATRATMDRMLAAGADDYITKPIDLRGLLATVDRLLLRSDCRGCRIG